MLKPRSRRAVPSSASNGARSKPLRQPLHRIPPILLEGDAPAAPAHAGPGERFVLGPAPRAVPAAKATPPGALPEGYGTGRLSLLARDPYWLYAHWDFARGPGQTPGPSSKQGQLTLRVYLDSPASPPCLQLSVLPETRSWFVNVGRSDTPFVAELGYLDPAGGWQAIATSSTVRTPPDAAVETRGVEPTATLPLDIPAALPQNQVQAATPETPAPPASTEAKHPLASADSPLPQVQVSTRASAPDPQPPAVPGEATERAGLIERRGATVIARLREIPRREVPPAEPLRIEPVHSPAASLSEPAASAPTQSRVQVSADVCHAVAQPTSPGQPFAALPLGGVSSGSVARDVSGHPGFWFNVNVELVVYGATEPDARLTIAGRAVELRPDGTFSLRFALPDGEYELPVVAAAKAGDEVRQAHLRFGRYTDYQGKVGQQPTPEPVEPPRPEPFAG